MAAPIEPALVPCPVRWPAEDHWSDHVCGLDDVFHDGPHVCERCSQEFTYGEGEGER